MTLCELALLIHVSGISNIMQISYLVNLHFTYCEELAKAQIAVKTFRQECDTILQSSKTCSKFHSLCLNCLYPLALKAALDQES